MELLQIRLSELNDLTVSALVEVTPTSFDLLCLVGEDVYRPEKLKGQTRIPAGRYEIRLRTEGGHHLKFTKKYGSRRHRGMLHLQNVPNFQWILVHPGNTAEDTEGCLLPGFAFSPTGKVLSSSAAYWHVYNRVTPVIEAGEPVFLSIWDFDQGAQRLEIPSQPGG